MAEHIIVNVSKAPCQVSLPSGRPIIILPGFAVSGDHFTKFISSGQLLPLAAIPAGFSVKGVSFPLAMEGIRSDSSPSHVFGGATKSAKNPNATKKATAVAMAESGKGTSEADILANVQANTGAVLSSNAPKTYEGATVEQWVTRLHSISDTTLGQQMKLNKLRELASFLGVESAEILQTKADLIQAVRVKTRG